MSARALGNHESLDFLFAQPRLGQPFARRQRRAVPDCQREFGLRSDEGLQDCWPSKLAG